MEFWCFYYGCLLDFIFENWELPPLLFWLLLLKHHLLLYNCSLMLLMHYWHFHLVVSLWIFIGCYVYVEYSLHIWLFYDPIFIPCIIVWLFWSCDYLHENGGVYLRIPNGWVVFPTTIRDHRTWFMIGLIIFPALFTLHSTHYLLFLVRCNYLNIISCDVLLIMYLLKNLYRNRHNKNYWIHIGIALCALMLWLGKMYEILCFFILLVIWCCYKNISIGVLEWT